MPSRLTTRIARLDHAHRVWRETPHPRFTVRIEAERFPDVAVLLPILTSEFTLECEEVTDEERDVAWVRCVARHWAYSETSTELAPLTRWAEALRESRVYSNCRDCGATPRWAEEIVLRALASVSTRDGMRTIG